MSTLDNLQQRYPRSLLKKKETAKELHISTSTLDRLRRSGVINSKKVGGGIYFTLKEIASFLDA
jgi:hypothetical protein